MIVAEDPELRQRLAVPLSAYGYRLYEAPDYTTALSDMLARPSDQVVPHGIVLGGSDRPSTQEALHAIRRHSLFAKTGVLVVSARIPPSEAAGLLDAGADDCYLRPFVGAIYAARVRGVLRRARPGGEGDDAEVLCFGRGLVVDVVRRAVAVDGQPAALSRSQFDLLVRLMRSGGGIVASRELEGLVSASAGAGTSVEVRAELDGLRGHLGRFGEAIIEASDGYFRMAESLVG
ncbi:MAG: response regulator transcription factor [Elusimicrobia bacterium]|nr:response regulator transcription factor [Elusimicrobiota bacterium]